ncbi:Propeptide PepSY amd peptidase M4 [Dissulfuribacter thermophilus]|uniref:Propeptide PepSY amd peptidase M4 n=1 Tax=Dissulfuribacter thermophilus TaxID=1156395 RepID=A0A1B9F6R6_9BACT|nr:PepSY domain-containing protein [Dissulfuribacter thermophilus]OCC15590.1 Propeptide PepSY amd peptidase M4 [Dissulfuribacter thermophilus]
MKRTFIFLTAFLLLAGGAMAGNPFGTASQGDSQDSVFMECTSGPDYTVTSFRSFNGTINAVPGDDCVKVVKQLMAAGYRLEALSQNSVSGNYFGIFVKDGVNEKEAKDANETQESQYLASKAKITKDQAISIAKTENPNANVINAQLEDENGQVVYGIEFDNGLEVKVDAIDGKVICTEQSDDGEANDE